jgi:polysaccharide pyruvyl transferase WcaK-like protein/MoaA/NifB/PqqE/SkfB family radical SAM enzyme
MQYFNKLYNSAKIVKKGGRLILGSAHQLVRHEWLGQYFPAKPTIIQFPVNDVCNSHCIMCNIWQRKKDKEITPEELSHILLDPLFDRVTYVGMSGGEPTLRKDLAEIGKVLVDRLPKLQGIGIITNGIIPQLVIDRCLKLARVAKTANKSFNLCVSLDGIGENHDRNRGVKGNFQAVERVIDTLKQEGILVSIGCTLTPINCYGADDVLHWCETNNIDNWEFRLGVEIKRVYNEGYSEKNAFTSEQLFHLIMFFDKLANFPNISDFNREFYQSLVGQLTFGLPRRAGCDWKTKGITLDTRGNISYCSVQSPIIGSALEKSSLQIYREGASIRQQIIREHCDTCQHDLMGLPPSKEMFARGVETLVQPWRKLTTKISASGDRFHAPKNINLAKVSHPSDWQKVLITGWYGTETAGDKAILGGILLFLKKYNPNCQIILTTIDRKVSQQTNCELPELANVTLVDLDRANDLSLIESVDAVIIGGGPLEEIPQTEYIWRIFVEANRQSKARIIFGCGVGPLYSAKLQRMVAAILQMSTAGFFRDEESLQYAIRLGCNSNFGCACDPALAYLQQWIENRSIFLNNKKANKIVGLVRANTTEYISDMTDSELEIFNRTTSNKIARILESVSQTYNAPVRLLPMHSLWVGGDDRIFNRQVASNFEDVDRIVVEKGYLNFDNLLQSLAEANVSLAMRYHGHLFSIALGIPFLSIDYTGKVGKVRSLLKKINYEKFSLSWLDMDLNNAKNLWDELIENRQYWSDYLISKNNILIEQLESTYQSIFGVSKI